MYTIYRHEFCLIIVCIHDNRARLELTERREEMVLRVRLDNQDSLGPRDPREHKERV